VNVPFLNRTLVESLPGGAWLAQAINGVVTAVSTAWDTEHAEDGTHGDVSATSLQTPTLRVGVAVNAPTVTSGLGSPEARIVAVVGSLYLRTDGGAGTSVYVKESGRGATSTGWVAK
jgi:hypothetical protein